MRGDVYWFKGGKEPRGREQRGSRYAVVVQADYLPLSTWLIVPTSTGRLASSFRPQVEIKGERTRVCVEQMTAVDPGRRLGDFVGRLAPEELEAVDQALRAVLDLL